MAFGQTAFLCSMFCRSHNQHCVCRYSQQTCRPPSKADLKDPHCFWNSHAEPQAYDRVSSGQPIQAVAKQLFENASKIGDFRFWVKACVAVGQRLRDEGLPAALQVAGSQSVELFSVLATVSPNLCKSSELLIQETIKYLTRIQEQQHSALDFKTVMSSISQKLHPCLSWSLHVLIVCAHITFLPAAYS